MNLSLRPPEEMTPQERYDEIIGLLAHALARALKEKGLTGLPPASKHSCDTAEERA